MSVHLICWVLRLGLYTKTEEQTSCHGSPPESMKNINMIDLSGNESVARCSGGVDGLREICIS